MNTLDELRGATNLYYGSGVIDYHILGWSSTRLGGSMSRPQVVDMMQRAQERIDSLRITIDSLKRVLS